MCYTLNFVMCLHSHAVNTSLMKLKMFWLRMTKIFNSLQAVACSVVS